LAARFLLGLLGFRGLVATGKAGNVIVVAHRNENQITLGGYEQHSQPKPSPELEEIAYRPHTDTSMEMWAPKCSLRAVNRLIDPGLLVRRQLIECPLKRRPD
jgi:hypothetical protein